MPEAEPRAIYSGREQRRRRGYSGRPAWLGGTGSASPQMVRMAAAARSNSSSAITGVPSKERSRSISTQERQPWYSSRTRTVTGRGMRCTRSSEDVQRMAALPVEALLRVVLGPDVERRQASTMRGRRPSQWSATSAQARIRTRSGWAMPPSWSSARGGRLLVGPDALLEGTAKLRMVGRAHEVVALVVEGGVEEEPLVLELEVLVLLADPALAQGDELLTLGEGAHRDGPLFEGNRHGIAYEMRSGDLGGSGAGAGRGASIRLRIGSLDERHSNSKFVSIVATLVSRPEHASG